MVQMTWSKEYRSTYNKEYHFKNKERIKEYYLKNKDKHKEWNKQWRLKNKERKKEYDKKWYQKNKERSIKQTLEWRKNNTERYEESAKKRLNSERGFFSKMWNDMKQKERSNSFRDFDDFYSHWLEQKKITGMKCPGTGVEMTTKALFNEKGKFKRCGTNISRDRILNSMGYSPQNLIFTSWNYNRAKSNFTPEMAKAFLKIVKERYGTDDLE